MITKNLKDKTWKEFERKLFEKPDDTELRKNFLSYVKNKKYPEYFHRDLFQVDYDPLEYPEIMQKSESRNMVFRGSVYKGKSKKYIVLIGAADAFGTMVQKPLSHMLENYTNTRVVNLGYGGASLFWHFKHIDNLIELINGSEMFILTVTSLRSIYFPGIGYIGMAGIKDPKTGLWINFGKEITNILKSNWTSGKKILHEITERSVDFHTMFMKEIKVPKILLLMPNKKKAIPEKLENLKLSIENGYPQFITEDYLSRLSESFDEFIFTQSKSGINVAVDRFTNLVSKWHHGKALGTYYVGQETHIDCFISLSKRLEKF